ARPYPGGVPLLGAKNIYTLLTLKKKYFVALEFLINMGVINNYYYNIPCYQEDVFFLHIQPIMKLWPRFLKQSGMFDHLPLKLLKKERIYNRKKDAPKNDIYAACDSYSLAFIEHVITNTDMTLLNDYIIE
ncbi:hypothetical protein HAX54_013065, partial [Datura stramonium]|nr:hypothetical protein [Datura stramonium]